MARPEDVLEQPDPLDNEPFIFENFNMDLDFNNPIDPPNNLDNLQLFPSLQNQNQNMLQLQSSVSQRAPLQPIQNNTIRPRRTHHKNTQLQNFGVDAGENLRNFGIN